MPTNLKLDAGLLPSNDRLLRGVKATLHRLAARTGDEQTRVELGAIDWILGELLLRHHPDFYVAYHGDLRRLVVEGRALLDARLDREAAAGIDRTLALLPARLEPTLDFAYMGHAINAYVHCLGALVESARGDVPGAIHDYVNRVCAKENEFHQHHLSAAVTAEKEVPQWSLTAEKFRSYLSTRLPERAGVRVPLFKQLVGGYQKVTILIDVEDDAGRYESWVMRSEKDDRFLTLDAGNVQDEFDIVKLAYDAGVPVAEPLWVESDKAKLGQRFFVSRKALGENYGSALASDRPITDEVARSFIKTMVQIHTIPVNDAMRRSALGRWLDFATLAENTAANVQYWMNQPWMAQANPSALYARLTTWLLDNVPKDAGEPRLTHGDFGPHNVLVHESRVSAVVDWETAHIGDPAEDISWFLQSCSGKLSPRDVLDWYEEFGGGLVSEYRLCYFDVFNCLKILTGSASAGAMIEAMEDASIEWCNIPLRWGPFSAALVTGKIAAADAVRGRR